MKNKKIDLLFALIVIAFLISTLLLVKDFKAKRARDYNDFTIVLTKVKTIENVKIKVLSNQLAIAIRENQQLKNALSDTRNDLDALSRKLAQPVVVPATAAPSSLVTVAPVANKGP